jgi:hypothetical protein
MRFPSVGRGLADSRTRLASIPLSTRWILGLSTGVLLIAAVRLGGHADALSIWPDETWSIWHSGKTALQILLERDLRWPFGTFLALHGWMQITGSVNDFALHTLGVFTGLLSAAFLVRAGRELRMPLAGVLAGLAFAASGYALYFSLEIRGYGLMLMAESAFVCLYARWLNSPTFRRGMPLLGVMIVMLYTQFITGLVIAGATLHLLLSRPRLLRRWGVLFGIAGIAFLPLLPQALRGFQLTTAVGSEGPLPTYFRLGFESFYRAHSAHWDLWFAVVLLCCALGLRPAARRIGWRTLAMLLIWAVGIPVAAFLAREHFAFFTTRYLAFTLPAAALLLGVGLASSPAKWVGVGALGIMALAPWQPFDYRPSYADFPPLRDFMRAMAHEFLPGDRLVVDPSLAAQVNSLEWIYYQSLYFAQGDFRLTESDESPARRVWYLHRQGGQDPVVGASVWDGRVQRASWGPWYLHAALFEAPPSDLGAAFGPTLRFLGADVDRLPDVHAGDVLPVRLWWAADHATSTDFPVTLELRASNGAVVARFPDPPQAPEAEPLPARIAPGEIMLDAREIQIPYHLNDGMYTLRLVLPQPGANAASPPGSSPQGDATLMIDQFHLVSFAIW